MKISSLVIAIFIFVGMTIGLFGYYSDFLIAYDITPVSASLYSSSSINALNNTMNDIALELKNISGKKTDFGAVIQGTVILFLKVIYHMLEIPGLIINIIADLLNVPWLVEPIPNWFFVMITTIITIYIVFRLASTVMGGRDL